MYVHSPDVPMSFVKSVCALVFYGLPLLWGKFSSFSAATANHYNLAFFIPPGTHHCCVERSSMKLGLPQDSSQHFYTCQAVEIEPQTF